MKKQYIYPQNMRTKAKLWFWNLRDLIIIGVALTVSVISWAKLGFVLPAALTAVYGLLSMARSFLSVFYGKTAKNIRLTE